ncbi:MAG: orc1/cdc6 family replication initiation protein [Anaerolineae bacterium]|nr:orc1/cdc6 family replication initiation protein [Anaerolineae bacterium]
MTRTMRLALGILVVALTVSWPGELTQLHALGTGIGPQPKPLSTHVETRRLSLAGLFISLGTRSLLQDGFLTSLLTDPFLWQAMILILLALATLLLLLLLRRRRSPGWTSSEEARWAAWESSIRKALWLYGRVEEEMLLDIPLKERREAMRRFVEERPEDDLVFRLDPPRIELAAPKRMKTFLSNWKAAWETVESEATFQPIAALLASQLCDMLGFTLLDARTYRNLHGYVVKAPALRLRVPPRFPIIFLRKREFSPEDIDDIRSLMNILNMTSYFALLIDLNDWPSQLDKRKNLKYLVRGAIHDLIVLDGSDLRQIIMARDHERRLIEIILSQVDLTVVSPYVTSGPVPENMFFGRDNELKTITRKVKDCSFALIGGRKIGKTSILAKVYRLLSETPNYFPLYLDCQAVTDYDTFFEAVNSMWEVELPSPSPDGFRRLITHLANEWTGGTIAILLDEVDALLSYDLLAQEKLFRVFRALSQEQYCRFVFCGERILYARLHAPDSPLFNFCDTIHLSYLEQQAARRMILEPMQAMGITMADQETVVREIMDLASCHPNLVQYICQRLIIQINRRGSRRITMADLEAVRTSSQFNEYFTEVTWGNASALEKLISVLIIDRTPVTLTDIETLLNQAGLPVPRVDLEEAVGDLVLYSIIRKNGQYYEFASQGFPHVIKASQDMPTLLGSLKRKVVV